MKKALFSLAPMLMWKYGSANLKRIECGVWCLINPGELGWCGFWAVRRMRTNDFWTPMELLFQFSSGENK